MSPVLLPYRSPPPPFLLVPHATTATATVPAVFPLEVSGNPLRQNGGGRRGALAVSSGYSKASRTPMTHGTAPPLSKYGHKYNDDDGDHGGEEDDEIDGDDEKDDADEDDLDFSSGKSKRELSLRLQELELDDKYVALVQYLSKFGLKESDFISIYKRRRPRLPTSVDYARKSLEFLLDFGVKQGDMKKVLKKQPQILSYTVENNLKPHVAFLRSLGIPESRIGRIIRAAPGLFSRSIELSLKPRIKYLIEEIGIKPREVGKVVQFCPCILLQPIDNLWIALCSFLSKELGAPRDSIAEMVTKFPPILIFSSEDSIKPRIDFLRSMEMHDSEILKVLTKLPQVLYLSVERNLKPKCSYLANELRHDVHSLTKYPKYLSLSLDQRIRPRHRFLVSLRKFPEGPFPLNSFLPADECFCQKWAETSLEKYLAFRETLLLNSSTEKHER